GWSNSGGDSVARPLPSVTAVRWRACSRREGPKVTATESPSPIPERRVDTQPGWDGDWTSPNHESPSGCPAPRRHSDCTPLPAYQLEGPKPARMYEVILPKKLGYFGKVQEVLEDLFKEPAIRAIPFVQQTIARRHQQDPRFDEETWIKTLCQASRGYSIYEMD